MKCGSRHKKARSRKLFHLRVERWELSKLNISSQSKAQCWFRKRKTELKIIEKTKICIPAMLKPYSASSFCLPNKNRVGVAHGDGTNLEVDKVRDTDSDYVMRKPSRCWLGAVPRYWNVVASCFRFSSFAENTSAALAPRAGISQPILLLFFLFSCSWICLQYVASDFFYSVSKFSGVRKKTELT